MTCPTDPGADVGEKTTEGGDDAPRHWTGDADDIKPGRDDRAKCDIESELGQKIATEPACRIVEGRRRPVESRMTGRADLPGAAEQTQR